MRPARIALDIARVRELELYLQNEPKAKKRLHRLHREFAREVEFGIFSFPSAVKRMGELVSLAAKNFASDYDMDVSYFPNVVMREAAKSLARSWWERQ